MRFTRIYKICLPYFVHPFGLLIDPSGELSDRASKLMLPAILEQSRFLSKRRSGHYKKSQHCLDRFPFHSGESTHYGVFAQRVLVVWTVSNLCLDQAALLDQLYTRNIKAFVQLGSIYSIFWYSPSCTMINKLPLFVVFIEVRDLFCIISSNNNLKF